ncbi:MAG TPA: formate dehydrogenase subunit gamma [Burkholderiales bacterium]|nr:formate dehydrogenase subunit gamma [Burkholderiales bacterium]
MLTRTRLAGWCFALSALMAPLAVAAQSAPGGAAQQQAERAVTQPGNNAPVWGQVRSGQPNYTTAQGLEAGVLVQSSGDTWRQIRNGPITVYGGWLVVIVALAIAAFYLVRGPIKTHDKPTGNLIHRFSVVERWAHWTMAISFCLLAVTGLMLLFGKHVLLPVIGYTLFAWLTLLGKNVHNFVGPIFMASIVVFFIIYVKDNWPSKDDLTWIASAGGLFTGKHVPSGRFNAGEKSWFWMGVVFLGIVSSVSGLILLFPNFEQLRLTMQQAHVVHSVSGILFTALSLGHIYVGTIGIEGSYQGMRTGYVDESWAKEHHELWYEDAKKHGASRPGVGGAVPAGAAQARREE